MMDEEVAIADVRRLTAEIVNTRVHSLVPEKLLRLQDVFRKSTSVNVLREVWKGGLVQVMLDAMCVDIRQPQPPWSMACSLAELAATCAPGCSPGDLELLNAPSCYLHLVGQLQQEVLIVEEADLAATLSLLTRVLDALLRVCHVHANLVLLVMHDPTLTMCCTPEDDGVGAAAFLAFLEKLILDAVPQVKLMHPVNAYELMEGLLFDLLEGNGGRWRDSACAVVMHLSGCLPNTLLGILQARVGLATLLSSKGTELPCSSTSKVADMCQRMWEDWMAGADLRKQTAAAITLQAAWRGRSARRNVASMVQGMTALQRLFRRRRQNKAAKEAELEETRIKERERAEVQMQARVEAKRALTQLVDAQPAQVVDEFLLNRQQKASVVLQKHWRRHYAQRQLGEQKALRRVATAAVTIQRAVRRWLKRRRSASDQDEGTVAPPVTGELRAQIQREIAEWQSQNRVVGRSDADVRELYAKARSLVMESNRSRSAREAVLDNLRDRVELFEKDQTTALGITTLESLTAVFGNQTEQLKHVSTSIQRQAREAHQRSLTEATKPWWASLSARD
eukprot:m.166853 g.166853  ORF g.166853 m.166853 type:complete len:565 (-) comp17182_c0_seq1:1879-3573(-)